MERMAEEVIKLAKDFRLPNHYIGKISKSLKKEHSQELIPFSRNMVCLIEKIKTHLRNSKLHEIDKDFYLIILDEKKQAYLELVRDL